MLEKEIEKRVCQYARQKGWLAYKFTSPGRRAVPDRMFISPRGQIIFIEFKRTGEQPTDQQLREHVRLRDAKQIVAVVDNVESGTRLIDLVE